MPALGSAGLTTIDVPCSRSSCGRTDESWPSSARHRLQGSRSFFASSDIATPTFFGELPHYMGNSIECRCDMSRAAGTSASDARFTGNPARAHAERGATCALFERGMPLPAIAHALWCCIGRPRRWGPRLARRPMPKGSRQACASAGGAWLERLAWSRRSRGGVFPARCASRTARAARRHPPAWPPPSSATPRTGAVGARGSGVRARPLVRADGGARCRARLGLRQTRLREARTSRSGWPPASE